MRIGPIQCGAFSAAVSSNTPSFRPDGILVAAHDIEFLEAAENYVNLHVRGRVYPLRSTMTAIQDRLDPARFARVHRSYIVNLDFLDQIEPLDTGDARLLLKNGSRIPCSRRYRSALRTAHTR